MRKYSKIEIAAMFRGCKDITDVIEACKIFYWMRYNWNENYSKEVFELGSKRAKYLNG